jgi:hypothetical protein
LKAMFSAIPAGATAAAESAGDDEE